MHISQLENFCIEGYQSWIARDSNQSASDIFNKILKNNGILARRDNSIFVTTDSTQAARYGDLYIILPLDPFEFTWSRNEKDIVLNSTAFTHLFDATKANALYDEIFENNNLPQYMIYDFLIPDESLPKNKIGTFSGFLGFNWEHHLDVIQNANGLPSHVYKMAEPENLVSWEKIQNKFSLSTTDFESAMDSENEIWINGSYVAITVNMESFLKKTILSKV